MSDSLNIDTIGAWYVPTPTIGVDGGGNKALTGGGKGQDVFPVIVTLYLYGAISSRHIYLGSKSRVGGGGGA